MTDGYAEWTERDAGGYGHGQGQAAGSGYEQQRYELPHSHLPQFGHGQPVQEQMLDLRYGQSA